MNNSKVFRFCTRQNLVYLTGIKAKDLKELLIGLKSSSDRSIYHHTHHYLQQHISLSPEPTNDFAYWLSRVYLDDVLGEKLASVDLREFSTFSNIRNEFVKLIEDYMTQESYNDHNVPSGLEFHFMEAQMFVFSTKFFASNLHEFRKCLEDVPIYSIYYHIFESRFWTGSNLCDFSNWLVNSLNEKILAERFMNLDPYTQTLEALRAKLLSLVEERIKEIENDKN